MNDKVPRREDHMKAEESQGSTLVVPSPRREVLQPPFFDPVNVPELYELKKIDRDEIEKYRMILANLDEEEIRYILGKSFDLGSMTVQNLVGYKEEAGLFLHERAKIISDNKTRFEEKLRYGASLIPSDIPADVVFTNKQISEIADAGRQDPQQGRSLANEIYKQYLLLNKGQIAEGGVLYQKTLGEDFGKDVVVDPIQRNNVGQALEDTQTTVQVNLGDTQFQFANDKNTPGTGSSNATTDSGINDLTLPGQPASPDSQADQSGQGGDVSAGQPPAGVTPPETAQETPVTPPTEVDEALDVSAPRVEAPILVLTDKSPEGIIRFLRDNTHNLENPRAAIEGQSPKSSVNHSFLQVEYNRVYTDNLNKLLAKLALYDDASVNVVLDHMKKMANLDLGGAPAAFLESVMNGQNGYRINIQYYTALVGSESNRLSRSAYPWWWMLTLDLGFFKNDPVKLKELSSEEYVNLFNNKLHEIPAIFRDINGGGLNDIWKNTTALWRKIKDIRNSVVPQTAKPEARRSGVQVPGVEKAVTADRDVQRIYDQLRTNILTKFDTRTVQVEIPQQIQKYTNGQTTKIFQVEPNYTLTEKLERSMTALLKSGYTKEQYKKAFVLLLDKGVISDKDKQRLLKSFSSRIPRQFASVKSEDFIDTTGDKFIQDIEAKKDEFSDVVKGRTNKKLNLGEDAESMLGPIVYTQERLAKVSIDFGITDAQKSQLLQTQTGTEAIESLEQNLLGEINKIIDKKIEADGITDPVIEARKRNEYDNILRRYVRDLSKLYL